MDLASNSTRIVALLLAAESNGAEESENRVVLLENILSERRRKLQADK